MIAAATGRGRRECVALIGLVLLSFAVIGGSVVAGQGMRAAPAVLAFVVLLAVFHAQVFSWRFLVGLTVAIILFVPIRRYSLPASLPFHLEPYRIIVAILIVGWLLTLLIDRGLRIRRTGLEGPLFLILVVDVISILLNRSRVDLVGSYTFKSMTFMLSYILILYLVVSALVKARDIDFFVRLLVAGGGVLGFFAIFESATHINVFNHLSAVLPILHYNGSETPETLRGGGLRVFASSQHPIALGAAFAMLIPLAVYRARVSGQARWWLAGVIMLIGLFATRSRTGVTMLIAVVIVYLVLRLRETRRFWWAILPLLLAIHFAAPGAIGSIKQSFFPSGGLLAQEKKNSVGSGRYATFGPVFHSEFTPNPIFGEGFATRVVQPAESGLNVPAAPILDDQWLGVLAETGVAGAFALGWLFVRSARRMGGAARRDDSPRGWLLAGATASVVAYAVGMLTYDAYGFIQVSFLLYFILAIGASALLTRPEEWKELEAARKPVPSGRQVAAPRERLAHARG
jgi:hypothetical protein